jgi:ABC-type nitrate/sulfonate/bicarbonate transport system substrate-binding protein
MKILAYLFLSALLIVGSAEAEPIRICRPNNMVSVLGFLAEETGAFAKLDVPVQFLSATNGKLCQDSVLARNADLTFTAEAPFVFAATSDSPLRVLADLGTNSETAVTARADRGITGPASLRSKRIAYLPGTVSYFYLVRLLERQGLKMADVNLVSMQPPVMTQALIGGSIDAMVMWEPWGLNARSNLGANSLVLRDPELYRYRPLLVGDLSVIQRRRSELIKVLAALYLAQEYFHQNPIESQQKTAPHIGLKPEQLRALWELSSVAVGPSEALVPLMREHITWLKRTSHLHQNIPMPPFENLVDFSLLAEAREVLK